MQQPARNPMPDHAVRGEWVAMGCPVPPPNPVKHAVLAAYGRWLDARFFIETGTYRGETTEAMSRLFPRVVSIEANPILHNAARLRFEHVRNVHLVQGDSGVVLREVLKGVHEPALFWLDAHWCGNDTYGDYLSAAIMGELAALFDHPLIRRHAVIIDDARYFVGLYGYPSVDFLRRWVGERQPDFDFDVAVDSIRIHAPRESP